MRILEFEDGKKPTISVVIPCYNSEKTIAKVVTLTREELVTSGYDYEFVLVNDGSKDGTFSEIANLAKQDPNVVAIDSARNLGQHNALICGLNQTRGDLIMLMDDDMQTHPSQCMLLVNAMVNGDDDVVFARWEKHREAFWRLLGSGFSSWSMQVMTKRPKDVFSSNFLVMRRHIRDEIVRYKGPYVYIQGLIFRSTNRISNVDVKHFEREEGKSGYTLKTLIKLWSNILNFSMLPLRFASVLGMVLGAIGLITGIGVVINKLLSPSMAAGWPSLMAALLFCSGVLLMSLGLVGEYLGRLFMTVNNSPQYVIREKIDHRDVTFRG